MTFCHSHKVTLHFLANAHAFTLMLCHTHNAPFLSPQTFLDPRARSSLFAVSVATPPLRRSAVISDMRNSECESAVKIKLPPTVFLFDYLIKIVYNIVKYLTITLSTFFISGGYLWRIINRFLRRSIKLSTT